MLAIVVPGMARSQLCPRGLARPGLEGLASPTVSQPASPKPNQSLLLADPPILLQAALQDHSYSLSWFSNFDGFGTMG